MRKLLMPLALFGTFTSAACATADDAAAPASPTECRNDPGQAYVGRTATDELGAEMLAATGAEILRWVPPGTAVTMDFRPDRLTVSYDANKVITRVSCG